MMIPLHVAPRLIDYKLGVIMAGIVGTLCFPWEILDNLFVFLGYYGAFLSAIGGIMVADYYILRRRRLNVPELYRYDGQFRYAGGFNWAGLIAWALAGGVACYYSQYAFVIGFPAGLVLYLLLMKAMVLPNSPQAEIQSGYSSDYLATSEGRNWAYLGGGAFGRPRVGEAGAQVVGREDL